MTTVELCAARINTRPVEDPLTHYVVTRRDLPRGVIAAQIVHAAGESSPGNLPEGTYAVVLAVENEAELSALLLQLVAAEVDLKAIREPTLGNSLTALGLAPGPKSSFRRCLSSIPLLR